MADPLVSVVIPAYEGERFLAEALHSVAAQSHRRVETIVVDDGSPDRSAEIAAEQPGVRVLRQPRGGVAAARNAGVKAASGELIAFLDQDDVWTPDKLERQVATLSAHPEIELVLCHIQTVLMPDTSRPSWLEPSWLTDPQPAFIPSTWLMRRETFERVGPFDVGYRIACDGDWLARFKDLGGNRLMLDEALVRWRLHDGNESHARDVMGQEILGMIRASVRRQQARERERQHGV